MNPLKTPASFGGKKSLLKKMVRNVKPTVLSTKKASLKSVVGKKMTGMSNSKTKLSATGGSVFNLDSGLGKTPNDAILKPEEIMGGRGTNLGTSGVM